MIGLDINLEVPQNLLANATATVVDPGVEFSPFNQLVWDFFDDGDVGFSVILDGAYVTYDAIFTILTPGVGFTGVSGLSGIDPTNYSVYFDPLNSAVVFHHDAGFDVNSNRLLFTVTASQVAPFPEPSTCLLLGGGLAGLAFVARRRKKE